MMNTAPAQRRPPLHARSIPQKQLRIPPVSKRPRSPEHTDQHALPTTKRVRSLAPLPAVPATRNPEKERNPLDLRTIERQQREAEFRAKYRKEFPVWRFYFDTENLDAALVPTIRQRVRQLGGVIEDFFSVDITHFITDQSIPADCNPDKENQQHSNPSTRAATLLKSPIKLHVRGGEDVAASFNLLKKALEYRKKIWTASKLDSVTARCLSTSAKKPAQAAAVQPPVSRTAPQRPQATQQQMLSRLLRNEKIHGTTERDPTQKRHDYEYFSSGLCFVLIEDIQQELSTIATHQYPPLKDKDPDGKTPWPALHCHPHSRNPFAPFDEKERRRWERTQQAEKAEEAERTKRKQRQQQMEALVIKRKAANLKQGKNPLDLRRAVSMGNMRRHCSQISGPHGGQDEQGNQCDLDEESVDTANASGFLASGSGMGYMAASANSVGITSTTGTTSTSGQLFRKHPMVAQERRHVVTSRKAVPRDKPRPEGKLSAMGPPSTILSRHAPLKKSKSTTTIKLPKREEGAKPGYCESCRVKFDDFSEHTTSSKHRKFAACDSNFATLDCVLGRLQRRTLKETKKDEIERTRQRRRECIENCHAHLSFLLHSGP